MLGSVCSAITVFPFNCRRSPREAGADGTFPCDVGEDVVFACRGRFQPARIRCGLMQVAVSHRSELKVSDVHSPGFMFGTVTSAELKTRALISSVGCGVYDRNRNAGQNKKKTHLRFHAFPPLSEIRSSKSESATRLGRIRLSPRLIRLSLQTG